MNEVSPTYIILLVEGKKPTAKLLVPVISEHGFEVVAACTRREALARARDSAPAVIVLDAASVRFAGHRFCQTLLDERIRTPVLTLLPEDDLTSRNLSARNHLRAPYSARKLINRINRLLPTPEDELLKVGDVVLNIRQRCVSSNGREATLTPKQAKLLETLMRYPGEVLTRALLMKQVWDTDYLGDTGTLDVHIHWVRKAIERDPGKPALLRTVRRFGYRFESPGEHLPR